MRLRIVAMALAILGTSLPLSTQAVVLADADADPPVVVDFSATPTSVNVAGGNASLTVSTRITDATGLTGNVSAYLRNNDTGIDVALTFLQRTSGTAQDGTYTGTFTLSAGLQAGPYTVRLNQVRDAAGNPSESSPASQPITITNDGAVDADPPVVVDFSATPTSVNVAGGNASLTVSTRITDATGLTGNVSAYLRNNDTGVDVALTFLQRTSGTAQDGTYTGTFTLSAGLQAGPYTVRLNQVRDAAGNPSESSPASQPITITNAPTVPSPPRDLVVSAGAEQVTASWSAPQQTGGSSILEYRVTATPGGQTCSTRSSLTCTITGLRNGTAYTFTVTATNSQGTSAPSEPSVPAVPTGVPAPPTQVTATAASGAVSVSWQAPTSNGGSQIEGYQVVATPGGQTCVSSTSLTCTVLGLTNGTTYTFTVTARNSVGTSAPSAPSNAATPTDALTTPGAVTALKASPQRGAIRVTWKAPASLGGATSVSYRYRVGKGPWTATSTTSVRVTGPRGKPLSVAVQAVTSGGQGPTTTVRGTPR